MTLESSAEAPLPLRTVARAVGDWVGRLGRIWVEGQLTQISRRPGQSTVFLTLRDTAADVSMQLTASRVVLERSEVPLTDGARVVCWVRPEVYLGRGQLQLTCFEIRPVGLGALLARLEALKRTLAGEGLFAADRKKPLPFLPRTVGLITGRASAAERDVVDNARRRWPAVTIEVRAVAVQGPGAVTGVIGALRELDADPAVDVIVVARGGGSVEDLLPFSDEALIRAVAACRTPVVSAIGHEPDTPLLDFVADLRASTPTDAGKRVVPDVTEERRRIATAADALTRAVRARLERERHQLDAIAGRPSLAQPQLLLDRHRDGVEDRARRIRAATRARVGREASDVEGLRARARAMSPAATLDRGYALVLRADGSLLRAAGDATAREALELRLSDGPLPVTVQQPGSARRIVTGRAQDGAAPVPDVP